MMAHMSPPKDLAAQARLMESYGAHAVYVTDSAGALTVDGARERVRALRDALQCEVGFHGHNNLSLAVANTLAAIEEGATWIDAAARGFGAGAGNTATEVLAAVLDRLGKNPGLDVFKLMDVAEELVPPVMQQPATNRSRRADSGILRGLFQLSSACGARGREIRRRCARNPDRGGQAQSGRRPGRHDHRSRI